jgi:hypothetical protein
MKKSPLEREQTDALSAETLLREESFEQSRNISESRDGFGCDEGKRWMDKHVPSHPFLTLGSERRLSIHRGH